MLINADFSRSAIVVPDQYDWIASPQGGVARVMLDRVGGEKARATSIVRYAPGSHFPHHQHPGGEEILVLSGAFSEGGECYPAGWYLRNPPGSSHSPSSDQGAIIFVKLWQMLSDDKQRVRIDTRAPSSWQCRAGREICPLFSSASEQVALARLKTGEALFAGPVDGAEILVIDGALSVDERAFPRNSWVRLPAGIYPSFVAVDDGATVYLKTGAHIGASASLAVEA